MIGKEIFKIWSPVGAKWVDWIRPVPFITIHNAHKVSASVKFNIPEIEYVKGFSDNIAFILDLPGYTSIEEGLGLAELGFRPIPVYNGTQSQSGSMALVDNHLEQALVWGAMKLQKMILTKEAPPVFLLDSHRMHRYKMNVSVFDNSWDLYEQDLPSADYFLNNGINKIIVRGETLQKDIAKILYRFQEKGLIILLCNGYEEPRMVTIKKPSNKQK